MKLLGKKLICNRGETFTFAQEIVDDDDVPYMLSDTIENPYLLLTVRSDNFRQDGGYIKNFWIDLSSMPTFTYPECMDDTTISDEDDIANIDEDYQGYLVYETQLGKYYYYDSTIDETTEAVKGWTEYSFEFAKVFASTTTRHWLESTYFYSIKIVGGKLTYDVLKAIYVSLYPGYTVPVDNKTLYKEIKRIRPDLVKNIRYKQPLTSLSYVDDIQGSYKILVKA